ncbi:hypothetical protein ALC53_08722 [Atta colombica]|uniref:Uncharacterized protein n=1 Tax=Atta colombica TaxID=520822 RepID=A0A151I204_9HYME|nr:hypothetical protein ALC53_08722 [Atta colombica]
MSHSILSTLFEIQRRTIDKIINSARKALMKDFVLNHVDLNYTAREDFICLHTRDMTKSKDVAILVTEYTYICKNRSLVKPMMIVLLNDVNILNSMMKKRSSLLLEWLWPLSVNDLKYRPSSVVISSDDEIIVQRMLALSLKDSIREHFVQVGIARDSDGEMLYEMKRTSCALIEPILTSLVEFQERDVLNLTGIQFPITLSQIERFECLNDISNVYLIEKRQKEILPYRFTDRKRGKYVSCTCRIHVMTIRAFCMNQGSVLSSTFFKNDNKNLCYFPDACTIHTSTKLEVHAIVENLTTAIRLPAKHLAIHISNIRIFNLLCLAYYVHCSYNNSLCMYQFRRGNDRMISILSANVCPWQILREMISKNLTAGPAHSNCNLNYKDSYCILIIFRLSENCAKIRFIDSFKFLSLEKLAYLDKDKLKITRSEFFNFSAEDFDLLTFTLKHTRINFELLTDVDIVLFIECDGLSQCSNRKLYKVYTISETKIVLSPYTHNKRYIVSNSTDIVIEILYNIIINSFLFFHVICIFFLLLGCPENSCRF